MATVISVRGLGKRYRLGARVPYKTLRESIAGAASGLLRAAGGRRAPAAESLWALRDLAFDVERGTTLGIIGRNGAGKTTLLKILSRVTEPTEGEARLRGRVASLLEVGTGFHPELTGRENVFLNGSIFGMSRREIRAKFDQIVTFAELERFVDTPVKRYSSGMYVRLAFAVAAHLEPEILIVDEVLAVGDAAFQSKCLGRIRHIGDEGRTVLFVSHNMSAVTSLCSEALCLEEGRAVARGPAEETVAAYLARVSAGATTCVDLEARSSRSGPGEFSRLLSISTVGVDGRPRDTFSLGDTLAVVLRFRLRVPVPTLEIGFCIYSSVGDRLQTFIGHWEGLPTGYPEGVHEVACTIDPVRLFPGTYTLMPWLKRQGQHIDDQIPQAIAFAVVGGKVATGAASLETYPNCGVFQPSVWSARRVGERGDVPPCAGSPAT